MPVNELVSLLNVLCYQVNIPLRLVVVHVLQFSSSAVARMADDTAWQFVRH